MSQNVYSLSPKGKTAANSKDLKAATHRGAVLLALKKLGKATVAEVTAEVEKQSKLGETDMSPRALVAWMLYNLSAKSRKIEEVTATAK